MVNKGGRPRKDGLGKKWTKTIWFRITFDHIKDPYGHAMAFNNSEALSRLIKDYLNSVSHPVALTSVAASTSVGNSLTGTHPGSGASQGLPIKINTSELPAVRISTPTDLIAQEAQDPKSGLSEDLAEATAQAKSKWLSNHDY